MKKVISKIMLIKLLTMMFVMIFIISSCEDESKIQGSVEVSTKTVTEITETSAKCGGSVETTGYTVGECGVCWSEVGNPTITLYRTTDQIGSGSFASTISGLQQSTKYYIRAYAVTSSGTLYGEEKGFTTEGISDPTGLLMDMDT